PNAREEIIELLVRHFHSPVEFIPQVERMYADGVRYFIEVGPKKTLASFVDNLLRGRPYTATCTDHPRRGDIYQFNEVLALLSSRGFDVDWADKAPRAGSRFYLPPFLSPGASPPEEVAVAPEAEGVTRFPLPKGDDLARYAATQAALEGEAVVIGAPSSHRLDDTLARAFEEMPDTTEIVAQHPRHGPLRLVEAAHLLRNSAQAHPLRVGFAAATFADLRRKIDAAREALRAAPEKRAIFARKGIFVGAAEIEGKTAFLFPGQGSQYIGMCRDLAEKYRVVRETFAEADEILHPILDRRLTDLLFTDSAMGKEERKAAEEALRQTEITQPAMLTADVAILRLLAEHGIHPDIVAGHSLGEYAACVAAGVMSFPDALRAVAVRGSAMGSIKGVGDPGKMASISAPEEKVAPILAEIPGYLAIANKNSYGQTVIAGESAAVDAAVKRFMALRIPAVPLSVSNAFHTRLVASAATPVRDFLRKIRLSPPRIPVIANVTARPYPSGPDAPAQIVERLTEQIVSSVEFIRSVEAMYEAGARIFIEVGPKRALTGFVENILSGREFLALPTNHPKKGGVLQFSEALAALSVNHHPFDWKTATPAPGNTLYTEFFRTMKEPAPLREETTMKRPADDVPPLDQPRDASVPAAPPSPAEKAPSSTASPRPITVAGEGSKTRSLLDLFGCLVDDEILALLDDDAFLPYLEAQQEVIRSFLKASFRQHKAFFARLTAEMGVEARPVVPPPAPAGIEDHPFPPAAPPAAEPRREGGARISAPVVPSSAVSSVEEGRPASTVTPPVQRAHPERREAPAAPASPPPAAAAPAAPRSPMEAMRAPVGEIPPEWIGADFEKVKRAILPLVVEKTGYPEEMLELDLDMEADLGIDTV
ncbi:MAG: acyltransferase domain-containing protein, partial [Deltaproteobacteria bacterium]